MTLEDDFTKKYIQFETEIKRRNNIDKYDKRTDYIKTDKNINGVSSVDYLADLLDLLSLY